jgi:hypothetical protein
MKSLKKDLRVVTRGLKALAKKTEKVMKAVDKLETAQAVPKRKPKPKAKSKRKAPAKKAVAKKVTRKKAAPKKAARKKVARKKAAPKKVARKKAAPKKATRKKAAPKKAARKKAAPKKAAAVTATDQVLKIIKRTKKGVDAPTLMKKTGLADKKVRNILMRASKQGRIKRAARGIYVAG